MEVCRLRAALVKSTILTASQAAAPVRCRDVDTLNRIRCRDQWWPGLRVFLPALLLAGLVAVPVWTRVVAGAPDGQDAAATIGVRNAHAMAFDAVRSRVLLFGGADDSSVREDTWAWHPARREWSRVSAQGPGPRTFPAMAFDAARGEVVLFGGNRVLFGPDNAVDTFLADTWVLRGDEWVKLPVSGPSARAEAAMAYDPVRRSVVLFGGYARTAQGRVRHGDTWEWDGRGWRLASTEGPPGRNGAALAFDQNRGMVILSGGPPSIVGPETWQWHGDRWTVAAGTDAPRRFNPVMTFHPKAAALLRFGGWTGRVRSDETFLLDSKGWRQLEVPGPSPRNHSAIAFDASVNHAVLFGGHDGERVFGDTWAFDGREWRELRAAPPRARVPNGH